MREFLFRQGPEWRTIYSRDQGPKASIERVPKAFCRSRISAPQKMAVSCPRLTAERFHKLWPIDTALKRVLMPSPEPNQRHPVRHDQVRSKECALVNGVCPRLGNTMHTSNCDV